MKTEIYTLIINNVDLQNKLALVMGKSYQTIRRWAIDANEMLSTNRAETVINEHLNGEIKQTIKLIKDKLEKWQYELGEKETEIISK